VIYKTQLWKPRFLAGCVPPQKLWQLLSLFCLSSTLAVLPACNFGSPAKPFSAEVNPSDSIAKITEVKSRPVWIRFLNTSNDNSASVGMLLKPGEGIRTEESARAQIHLLSGAVVRVEGESSLTLSQKDLVTLDKGQLLAWSSPSQTTSTQIQTSFGIVSVKNTTVYIDIPKDTSQDKRILALQGNVEVRLNSGSEPIKLKPGQELTVKANGTATTPQTLDTVAVEKKLAKSNLIYGFNSRLESLAAIESQLKISDNSNSTEKVPYRSKAASRPKNNPPPPARTYEEPAPVDNYQPPARETPRDTYQPPQTSTPSNPAQRPDPLALPQPAPVTPQAAEPPPQPVQPEIAPEPPPQPVQPEVAPAAPPSPSSETTNQTP
jgi:FecR protein